MFDATLFTDATIVSYCAAKNLNFLSCALADVNEDGAVNSVDKALFDNTTPQYDLNVDGVIN